MSSEMEPTDEIVSRQNELFDQLANIPPVEVSGVVSHAGVNGGMIGRQRLWTVRFSLAAWRIAGGEIRSNALAVTRSATEDELRALQASVAALAVVRIRARVAADQKSGGWRALLEEVLGPDDGDLALKGFAEQLNAPVRYQDSFFGIMTLDRRVGWYSVECSWNGCPAKLMVPTEDAGSPADGLLTARRLWDDQAHWDQRVKDCALLRLLPLKNERWSDTQELPLSASEFRGRMRLESVTAHPDGLFDFWFNDGDLFSGHAICISGDLTNGPTTADICG
jgi:hypothetical protein